ncbi:hypothetical protein [Legionella israelensis]|nr:hypothetical protein [Legionella israelensis]
MAWKTPCLKVNPKDVDYRDVQSFLKLQPGSAIQALKVAHRV